jgi:hypothetical protein
MSGEGAMTSWKGLKKAAALAVSAALLLASVPAATYAQVVDAAAGAESAATPHGGPSISAPAPISLSPVLVSPSVMALSPSALAAAPAPAPAAAAGAAAARVAPVAAPALTLAPAAAASTLESPTPAQAAAAQAAAPAAAAAGPASSAAAPETAAPGAAVRSGVAGLVRALTRRAAVPSANQAAADQGRELSKVYEGVGPQGADRAVFTEASGPVMRLNYQPAGAKARPHAALDKARTPVHILIGSGAAYGRGWVAEWNKQAVDEIGRNEIPGLRSLVIDSEANRPADAEYFVAADLADQSEENKKAVAAKVVEYLEKHNLQAAGANAFVQGYIRWAPVIQDAVSESNNPRVLINPAGAVETTVDKLATRTVVGKHVASLAWPAVSPGAVDDPEIEEKAVATFREVAKQTPSGKVVLKMVTAAGKAGLRAGGIGTEEEMRQAIREVVAELKGFWANSELHDLYLGSDKNGAPRFLIEGLIDRLSEVDVELTASVLTDGTIDILGFIIGNPNPGDKEKGYLFGMKGLLSEELQRRLVLAAVESVVASWKEFEGLPFGNFHVELILRGEASDPQPALVEINATRPIGGSGVRFAKEWHPEINLIRAGLRASLGLPQLAPKTQPQDSLLALGITPSVSGTIEKAESPADMTHGKMSDFGTGVTRRSDGPVFVQLSEKGEHVEGAETPHPGGLGAMTVRGADAPDAVKNNLRALDRVSYEIRKADGQIHHQKGGEEHSEADYTALPKAPAASPTATGLTPKAQAELDKYEEAQLRWTPIFKVYYPLFSALMNAMGGLAAIGIGRIGYTLALFVSTPFASVVASRLPVKTVLKYTWAARIAVWAALVPLAVFAFPAGAALFTIPLLGGVSSLQAALFALNFVDGLMVSFSHTVDMDAGGMDEVAKQNGFKDQMTPEVRKHYGTRYMAWSSKAQYIFPLGVALAVAGAAFFSMPIKWAFTAGMAGVFLIQGGRAIVSINKMNSDVTLTPTGHGVVKEFAGGLAMVAKDKKLLGLVTLESLERSIGDALFMVAFPMLGLFAIQPAFHLDSAGANLAATVLMSIMSFAGMKASLAARKNWKAPEKGAAEYPSFKPLFPQMFIAATTLLSIPAAYALMTAGGALAAAAGLGVAALGAVLFMMSFKKAQIGAMNMFQTAAGEHQGSTRIFGIASAVSMLVSGFAVWALADMFPPILAGAAIPAALPAFLGLSAFFLAIGAAYWLIWPRLASKTPAATPNAPKK